MLITATADLWK